MKVRTRTPEVNQVYMLNINCWGWRERESSDKTDSKSIWEVNFIFHNGKLPH